MKRIHFIGLSAMALSLSLSAPARAQFSRDVLSAFEQTAAADVIVIGRVTGIESETVLEERAKGAGKVTRLVATIRIEEKLLGTKGLTHLRVGPVPELPPPAANPVVKSYR